MPVSQELAEQIKAQAALPALRFHDVCQGEHERFTGKLEMAEWVHRFICDFAREHQIKEFDDAFRRALRYGVSVALRKESAIDALDALDRARHELNFTLEAIGGLIKTISDWGEPTTDYKDNLVLGLNLFSERIRKSIEDSTNTIHAALRDPEPAHALPHHAAAP
jgi:hypothetical protein